jgi:hypothetical protein
MNSKKLSRLFVVAIAFVLVGSFALVAEATHSWGGYHWARTSNPFTLQLGNNTSAIWSGHLATVSNDWSQSAVMDAPIAAGQSNRNCRATKGRVEICDNRYGLIGWLGIAQIWVNSDHIVQGTVKLNDSYFSRAPYNTSSWRQFVACQEVGHTFGLDHQDENFYNQNLGTCMDYTNDPARNDGLGDNQHPNQHDYDELATIYSHLDSITTVGHSAVLGNKGKTSDGRSVSDAKSVTDDQNVDFNDQKEWGKTVRKDAHGKNSLYKRDFGNSEKLFTFVIWAE